jgi:hypothetical protein
MPSSELPHPCHLCCQGVEMLGEGCNYISTKYVCGLPPHLPRIGHHEET